MTRRRGNTDLDGCVLQTNSSVHSSDNEIRLRNRPSKSSPDLEKALPPSGDYLLPGNVGLENHLRGISLSNTARKGSSGNLSTSSQSSLAESSRCGNAESNTETASSSVDHSEVTSKVSPPPKHTRNPSSENTSTPFSDDNHYPDPSHPGRPGQPPPYPQMSSSLSYLQNQVVMSNPALVYQGVVYPHPHPQPYPHVSQAIGSPPLGVGHGQCHGQSLVPGQISGLGHGMPLPAPVHAAPPKVKMLVSSGGSLVRCPETLEYEYKWGSTRLVAVEARLDNMTLAALRPLLMPQEEPSPPGADTNSNSTATTTSQGGVSGGGESVLSYLLPSDPKTLVSVSQDSDVQLMFEEWAELRNPSTKLRVFLESPEGAQLSRGESAEKAGGGPGWMSSGTEGRSRKSIESGGVGSGESTGTQADNNSPENEAADALRTMHRDRSQLGDMLRRAGEAEEKDEDDDEEGERGLGGVGDHECDHTPPQAPETVELIREADIQMIQAMPVSVGGYGVVHRALWNGVEVAVKYLAPELMYGLCPTRHVEEFYREASLLSSLHHPNVVTVYGLVIPEEREEPAPSDAESSSNPSSTLTGPQAPPRSPALVTEYLRAGSLTRLLARHPDRLSSPMRVSLALSAARGMEYLHRRQIVHFDLKSDNLLIDQHPGGKLSAKVCDFGLSKQRCRTYVSGLQGERGTVQWMAPEVVKTPERVDELVDVYSFGIVMWELWTSKMPYADMDKLWVLGQMMTSELRPPIPGRGGSPEISPPSPQWESLMTRCWSQEPSLRPSFTAIAAELEEMKKTLKKEVRETDL